MVAESFIVARFVSCGQPAEPEYHATVVSEGVCRVALKCAAMNVFMNGGDSVAQELTRDFDSALRSSTVATRPPELSRVRMPRHSRGVQNPPHKHSNAVRTDMPTSSDSCMDIRVRFSMSINCGTLRLFVTSRRTSRPWMRFIILVT